MSIQVSAILLASLVVVGTAPGLAQAPAKPRAAQAPAPAKVPTAQAPAQPPAQAPGQVPGQPPAAAPPAIVSNIPQATTATYGDWVLRCEQGGEAEKAQRLCEIAQTLQIQGQGPVAQLAVGSAGTKDQFKLTILLPNNVSFPSSVKMATDAKDAQPVDLVWKRCIGSCLAEGEMKDETIKRWKPLLERGEIRWKNGSGQDVVLPFSFRGFAQAFDALAKQ